MQRAPMSGEVPAGTAEDGIGIRGLTRTRSFLEMEFSTVRSDGDSIRRASSLRRRFSSAAIISIGSDVTIKRGVRAGTTECRITLDAGCAMERGVQQPAFREGLDHADLAAVVSEVERASTAVGVSMEAEGIAK